MNGILIAYKLNSVKGKVLFMETTKIKQLKYTQIAEDLKELIFSDQIQAGDKLPSENELSQKYRVSRQTVRKAIAILESAGYVYAEHGRGTFCSELVKHSRTSNNIAVVTTYISDYIFPKVIKGIDSVLTAEGYSIILKNTKNSRSGEARCLEELLQKDIDGMIIEPSKSHVFCHHMNLYHKLDEFQIPYVFIQGCFEQMKDKPNVSMDDVEGGYMITNYLISLGHKEIIGVFKSDDSQGQYRHRGYVKALQEAGIMYNPDSVIWFYTEDRKIHPYERIKQMVQQGKKIDAVVCYNDQVAGDVIKALNECCVKVPDDVSVTGYDNSQITSLLGMKLTTVVHPQEELGMIAARMLLSMIKREECERNIKIRPEIVIGDTCKAKNK